MNKERMKQVLMFVLAVLLAGNCAGIYALRREVKSLEGQLSSMSSSLRANIDSLNYGMGSQIGSLESLIKNDRSMLSLSSVDYRLKGNRIQVTMQAIPKTLSDGEELFARVYAGERMYEAKADVDGVSVVETEMAEYVRPVFVIKSADGVRQEALDEVYTGSLFEAGVETRWGAVYTDGLSAENTKVSDWELTAWVYDRNGSLPFDRKQVSKAEFVVRNSGVREETEGTGSSSVEAAVAREVFQDTETLFLEDTGERIEAREILGIEGERVGYWADLSRYQDRRDGMRYDVYFCLTLADGERFHTPYGEVASFSSGENSSTMMTTSDGILMPVY